MGWGAGLKLHQVLDHLQRVLAVELVCAAEGVRHRSPAQAPATAAVVAAIRQVVPPLEADRVVAEDLATVADLIADGTLIAAAEQITGPLH